MFAAQNGVAPAVHYAENGILVTDYVPGRTLEIDDAGSPALRARLAAHLAVLHALPTPDDIPIFDPADSTRFYLENLPSDQLGIKQRRRIESILSTTPQLEPISLIHADIIPENIVDDGEKLWLIDWEYAGSGHPAIDLAFIAMNFELTDYQLDSFVALHGDLNPGLVRSLKPVIIAREALWCLVQLQAEDSRRGDLVEYSRKCLRRLGRKS
jgi:thiamine kinase-like enzyme